MTKRTTATPTSRTHSLFFSILILVLSLLAIGSQGLIYKKDFTFDQDLGSVTYALFKFKKGANVTFEPTKMEFVDPTKRKSTSVFFLFKKNEWKNKNPCNHQDDYAKNAYIVHIFKNTSDVLRETIQDEGSYYAVMSTCNSTYGPIKISSTTTFINPGFAKHLSADDQARPYMYDVFVGVWAVLLLAWIANWAYVMILSKDKSQVKKKLHITLSIYVLLKMLTTLFLLCYWNIVRSDGDPLENWIYLYYALYILETLSFYGALILISSGWDIVNDDKLPRDWKYAALAIGIYGIVQILTLYVDVLYFAGSIAEMVVLFIIIIMIGNRSANTLILIFDKLEEALKPYKKNNNGEGAVVAVVVDPETGKEIESGAPEKVEVKEEREVTRLEDIIKDIPKNVKKKVELLQRQFKMINIFRYIFIGYLIGKIIVMIVLMIGVDEWIGSLLYMVLDVAVAVAVGVTFRLHKIKTKGNYFLLENEFDEDDDDEYSVELENKDAAKI